MKNETKTKAFNNHKTNGFLLTFPNGNNISTIFGGGTYSDNHNRDYNVLIEEGSNTVEVMIQCGEKLHKRLQKKYDGDSVTGYLTMEQWLDVVRVVSKEKK